MVKPKKIHSKVVQAAQNLQMSGMSFRLCGNASDPVQPEQTWKEGTWLEGWAPGDAVRAELRAEC